MAIYAEKLTELQEGYIRQQFERHISDPNLKQVEKIILFNFYRDIMKMTFKPEWAN